MLHFYEILTVGVIISVIIISYCSVGISITPFGSKRREGEKSGTAFGGVVPDGPTSVPPNLDLSRLIGQGF